MEDGCVFEYLTELTGLNTCHLGRLQQTAAARASECLFAEVCLPAEMTGECRVARISPVVKFATARESGVLSQRDPGGANFVPTRWNG
jgi:hypothetical protein